MSPASKKKIVKKKIVRKKAAKEKIAKEKVARKKVTKKKAVSTKKATAKKTTKKAAESSKPDMLSVEITPEERWKMIAVAAYHRAEKRGFAPGNELQDWAEAEKEINALLPHG